MAEAPAAGTPALQRLQTRAWLVMAALTLMWLPGAVLGVIALWAPPGATGLQAWAVEHWVPVLLWGLAAFLIASVALKFVLRCPHCGFRLSRAGISAHILANPWAGVRHCPQCGGGLREG